MSRTDDKIEVQIKTPDLLPEQSGISVRVSPSDFHLAARIMADDIPEATARVLEAIRVERGRQRQLWLEGKLPFNCDDENVSPGDKMAALVEEVGEVAREVNEANNALHPGDPLRRLRTELIQVAAVATAWAESLPAEP